MEEDIKVLEEFIEEIKEILEQIDDYTNLDTYAFSIDYKQTKALKNLIKGYKELEEKVNKYEKQIDLEWVEENYIEKSKYNELVKRNKELEEENFNLKEKQIIDKYEVKEQDNFFKYYYTKEEIIQNIKHITKRIEFISNNIMGTNVYTCYDVHCLKVLINEYNELKKLEDVTVETLKDTNYIHNNYIPKSKVREVLKEIDDNNTDEGWWYINKIEELLQDKE